MKAIEKFSEKLLGQFSLINYIDTHRIELQRAIYNMNYSMPVDEFIEYERIKSQDPLLGFFMIQNELMSSREKINRILDFVEENDLIAMVCGGRGSGKTAYVSWLIDKLHAEKPDIPVYWLHGSYKLPKWVNVCYDLKGIPGNCVVIIDEAGVHYFSREFMRKDSKNLSKQLAVSRHAGWKMFFISQLTSSMDKMIFSMSDVLVQKKASSFVVMEGERGSRELKKYVDFMMPRTKQEFLWFDGDEMIKSTNTLPLWWCTDISKPYAKITEAEAVDLLVEMHNARMDIKKIQEMLMIKGVDWTLEEIKSTLVSPKTVKRAILKEKE